MKHPPHEGIQIGSRVNMGNNIVLDVPLGGSLCIGDGAKLTMHVVVAAANRVEIGSGSQIAEYVSIRDSDHGILLGRPIEDQPLLTAPVLIQNDVWIGRGVAVLRGSVIEAGAVVGANSVVKGTIARAAIAVGAPARIIGVRQANAL